MPFPFYVAPEQFMKDRADYARKGIARGKAILALVYRDGVVLVAENPSASLHKISEIYDRIAFAAVGKYNEFEVLRVAGVRYADLRGYSYGREDVTARSLANAYSQTLGTVFTQEMKPYEVELLVAEVGEEPGQASLFHIMFDGSITDEQGFAAMGGQAEEIYRWLKEHYRPDQSLEEAVRLGVRALREVGGKPIDPGQLEVACLDRNLGRRTFRRLTSEEIASYLAEEAGDSSGSPRRE